MTVKAGNYVCETHGDIGMQTLRVGVYIKDEYKQADFCGLCHYEMLMKECKEAKKVQHGN